MKLTLDEKQVAGVEYAMRNNYHICAMDMGLGKAATSLESAMKRGGRTLVVCPSYLLLNWKDEITKWYGESKIVSLFKNKKSIYPVWDTDIALISYESLTSADPLFAWCKNLIFDEGHYMKNMDAKRTENAHRLTYENSVENVTILTGTPILNRVGEFYSLIAMCGYNPHRKQNDFLERFPDQISFSDYFSYREEYSIPGRGHYDIPIVKWSGSRNEDELRGYLKGIYYRAKAEAGISRTKEVIISEEEDYELAAEMEDLGRSGDSLAGPAKLKAALRIVPDTIKYCKDILDEVGQLVIYSDHVEPAELIAKAFGVPVITGNTPVAMRHEISTQFFKGAQKVLVATIQSFSTGVNNLVVANNMVFNDPPWSPGIYNQARFRISRKGQTKMCIFHNMIGSAQTRKIYEILAEKQSVINEVT